MNINRVNHIYFALDISNSTPKIEQIYVHGYITIWTAIKLRVRCMDWSKLKRVNCAVSDCTVLNFEASTARWACWVLFMIVNCTTGGRHPSMQRITCQCRLYAK